MYRQLFEKFLLHYAMLVLLLLLLQHIDKGLTQSQMFQLTEANFEQFTKDKDIMLVEFIMPWCKHCQKLQPEWDKASEILASNKEYVLGKVNCWEDGKALCDKLQIPMFPEIRLYRHGNYMEKYDGDRTAAGILDFIQRAQATTGSVGRATASLLPASPTYPAVPVPPPNFGVPGPPVPNGVPYAPPLPSPPPSSPQPVLQPPPTQPPPPQQPIAYPPLANQPSAPQEPVKTEAKEDFLPYASLVPPPPMAQQAAEASFIQSFMPNTPTEAQESPTIQYHLSPQQQQQQNQLDSSAATSKLQEDSYSQFVNGGVQFNVAQSPEDQRQPVQQSFTPLALPQQQPQVEAQRLSSYNGNTNFWDLFDSRNLRQIQPQQFYEKPFAQPAYLPEQGKNINYKTNLAAASQQSSIQPQLQSKDKSKLQDFYKKPYSTNHILDQYSLYNTYSQPIQPALIQQKTPWERIPSNQNYPPQQMKSLKNSEHTKTSLKQPSLWNIVQNSNPKSSPVNQVFPIPTKPFTSVSEPQQNIQRYLQQAKTPLKQTYAAWLQQQNVQKPPPYLSLFHRPLKSYDGLKQYKTQTDSIASSFTRQIANPMGYFKPRLILPHSKLLDEPNVPSVPFARTRTNSEKDQQAFVRHLGYLSPKVYSFLLKRRKQLPLQRNPQVYPHLYLPLPVARTVALSSLDLAKQKYLAHTERAKLALTRQESELSHRVSPSHAMAISKQRALQIAKIRAARNHQRQQQRFNTRQPYNKQIIFPPLRHAQNQIFYNVPTRKNFQNILVPEEPRTDQALIRTKVFSSPPNARRNYFDIARFKEIQMARYPYRRIQKFQQASALARQIQIATMRSKQNAARVNQAKLAHFFTPRRKFNQFQMNRQRNIQQTPNRKSETQQKSLIGFWDKLYKYYSNIHNKQLISEATTRKPVVEMSPRESNMKELDLVETFLASKFKENPQQPLDASPTIKLSADLFKKKQNDKDAMMRHEIRTKLLDNTLRKAENEERTTFQDKKHDKIISNDNVSTPKLSNNVEYFHESLLNSSTRQRALQASLLKLAEPPVLETEHLVSNGNDELTKIETNSNSEIGDTEATESEHFHIPSPELALDSVSGGGKAETNVAMPTTRRSALSQNDGPTIRFNLKENPTKLENVHTTEDVQENAHTTEDVQEKDADALLKEAQGESNSKPTIREEIAKTVSKQIDDPTTRVASEFLLKAISHRPEPWDKRAKVTFKLSKKNKIPNKPLDVVGIFGSLKKRKRKKKRKRSHEEKDYIDWLKRKILHRKHRHGKSFENS